MIDDLGRAIANELSKALEEPLAPGLYLVATPIGNLADISIRALAVLSAVDIVYCEDTRHSAKLFSRYAISAKTRPLHEHNEEAETARVVRELNDGKSIAIISDAGTPIISDPGFRVAREAAKAGCKLFSIPGPAAAIAAITVSALPADSFFFAGFLPPKQAARRSRLAAIASIPGSVIIYEAPHRLSDSLRDMADVLGNRDGAVLRELTKVHEDVSRGKLSELAEATGDADIKGEVVVVVGPPVDAEVGDELITERLERALEDMSLKDASRVVAGELGVPKTRVYEIGLRSKAKGS